MKTTTEYRLLYGTETADGLCYQLTKACPKEPEVIPFKELEINRSEIQMTKKLGAGQFGEVWAGTLPTSHCAVLVCVWINCPQSFLWIHRSRVGHGA